MMKPKNPTDKIYEQQVSFKKNKTDQEKLRLKSERSRYLWNLKRNPNKFNTCWIY